MKESYGGYSPSQSELTRSHSRGYAGYMDNRSEINEALFLEQQQLAADREARRVKSTEQTWEEYAKMAESNDTMLGDDLNHPSLLMHVISHQRGSEWNPQAPRSSGGKRYESIGMDRDSIANPAMRAFLDSSEKIGSFSKLSSNTLGHLLAATIENMGDSRFANDEDRHILAMRYSNIANLLDQKGHRQILELKDPREVQEMAANLPHNDGDNKNKMKGAPEYLNSIDIRGMDVVCKLIADTYGDEWREGGSRQLLKSREGEISFVKRRIPEEDEFGNQKTDTKGKPLFKKETRLEREEVSEVDQGNFVSWVRDRIMWFHDDSPEDVYNFQQVIGVENPYRNIGLNQMLKDAPKYFKSSRVTRLAPRILDAPKDGEVDRLTSQDIIKYQARGIDVTAIRSFNSLSTSDKELLIKSANFDSEKYVFEAIGDEMYDIRIIGQKEEIVLKELVEQIKRETWMASTGRAKDIAYRGGMGSDEGLPKTFAEICKDNNFTKSTWSNKSLWYWMVTLPSNFHTTINGVDYLNIIDEYEYSDDADAYIKSQIERSFGGNQKAIVEFINNFRASSEDQRKEMLLDISRKEDAKAGHAVVGLYMTYSNVSDYDKLREMYGEDSILFQPKTLLKQRHSLALNEALDEEIILGTADLLQMYGIDKKAFNEQKRRKVEAKQMEEFRWDTQRGNYDEFVASLSSQEKARLKHIVLSIDEIGNIANDLNMLNAEDSTKRKKGSDLVKYFNFFTAAAADKRNINLARGVFKEAVAEKIGWYNEDEDGVKRTDSQMSYADMLAFSQVRWTMAAAKNDTGAAAYDAATKILDIGGYRQKLASPERGGAIGNWYNAGVYKQTGRDFMTAILTNSVSGYEVDKKGELKETYFTPEEVFMRIFMANGDSNVVEEAKKLTFNEQTMAQAAVNHYNRAFEIFHSIMGAKELRMEKLITFDPITGPKIDPASFGEAVQEAYIKPSRYGFSTHSGIDFSKIVRKRVKYDKSNAFHKRAVEDGATVYDDGAIILDMPIALSMFGSQVFDNETFWKRDEHGRPIEHEIDIDKFRTERKAIFKHVILMRVAADLRSHRDPASPFARFDAHTVDVIIEALELIPGGLFFDETDVAHTAITASFFSHPEIDFLRKAGHVELERIFAEDGAKVLLSSLGSVLGEASGTALKAIFS